MVTFHIRAHVHIYYEIILLKGKSNQQDPKRGYYKSIRYMYIAYGGIKPRRYLVLYDYKNIPLNTKFAFRCIKDSVATAMTKILDFIEDLVKKSFINQFEVINYILIR